MSGVYRCAGRETVWGIKGWQVGIPYPRENQKKKKIFARGWLERQKEMSTSLQESKPGQKEGKGRTGGRGIWGVGGVLKKKSPECV